MAARKEIEYEFVVEHKLRMTFGASDSEVESLPIPLTLGYKFFTEEELEEAGSPEMGTYITSIKTTAPVHLHAIDSTVDMLTITEGVDLVTYIDWRTVVELERVLWEAVGESRGDG